MENNTRDDLFDVVIIGGGTYGAALFLTCILSGKKILLIEKGLVGRGTNGKTANYASTRMIQPGLKYVQSDISLVKVDAQDCRLIKTIAPEFLQEKAFLLPIYEDYKFPLNQPWLWEIYLNAYDEYSRLGLHQSHQRLSSKDLLGREPTLKGKLIEGMLFWEWVVDPVKLSNIFVSAGKARGGTVLENTKVIGFETQTISSGKKIISAILKDQKGNIFSAKGRYFINACGAWVSPVAKMLNLDLKLRPTRGTTVVIQKSLVKNPLVLFDKEGKYITILPQNGRTLIGPTNCDVSPEVISNPDLLKPNAWEIDKLLETVYRFLDVKGPHFISEIKCGLRPQLNHQGVDPYNITHQIGIFNHRKNGIVNFCSVAGGKLTSQLRLAKEVAQETFKELNEKFEWKIPQITIGIDGKIEETNSAARVRLANSYRQKRALYLNCDSGLENTIYRISLTKRALAIIRLVYYGAKYFKKSIIFIVLALLMLAYLVV